MADTDKILDNILSDGKNPNMEYLEENEVLEPLLEELELIQDEKIQSFTRSLLLKGGCFWYIPASFSGDHHPPDEHDEGGNVLHTKRVVRACVLLADSHSLEQEERNLLYAAALLHDLTKGVIWDITKQPSYDTMHPYTVDRFLRLARVEDQQYKNELQSTTMFVDEDTSQAIMRLVRCHMGPWSPVPETHPLYALEMILHTADHIAANLHWIIDGNEAGEHEWRWILREPGILE